MITKVQVLLIDRPGLTQATVAVGQADIHVTHMIDHD